MMSMTFYPFNTYQVTVVWDWWNIQTKGQYAASCLAIVCAVVLYRGLVKVEARFVRYAISLGAVGSTRGTNIQHNHTELGAPLLDLDAPTGAAGGGSRPLAIPVWCRLVQALLSGALYGYALLLMLVAMAYNPGLFISLMVGWVIGELLFPISFDAAAWGVTPSQGKAAACCER